MIDLNHIRETCDSHVNKKCVICRYKKPCDILFSLIPRDWTDKQLDILIEGLDIDDKN
jgi:hypothetical protein